VKWKAWLQGLGAAVISGAATAASGLTVTSDPKALGKIALTSGIISGLLFLKQSPLPNDNNPKPTN
jgi:hypothetical protein